MKRNKNKVKSTIVGKNMLPKKEKGMYVHGVHSSDPVVKRIITSLPFFQVSSTEWKVPLSKLIARLNSQEDMKYIILAQRLQIACQKEWYSTIELIKICNKILSKD